MRSARNVDGVTPTGLRKARIAVRPTVWLLESMADWRAKVTVTDGARLTASVSFAWTAGVVVQNPGGQAGTTRAAVSLAMSASGGKTPYAGRPPGCRPA